MFRNVAMYQNKMFKKMVYSFATLGGLGYFPYAPGTLTSGVAVLLFWMLKDTEVLWLSLATIALFFFGVKAAQLVAIDQKKHDPSIVVIDEWVGMWLTLLITKFYPNCFPKVAHSYLFLFLLFRFFDISKPFLIKRVEKVSGGWGIMIDDIIAAAYAIVFALLGIGLCS